MPELISTHNLCFKATVLKHPANKELEKDGWRRRQLRVWINMHEFKWLDCYFRLLGGTLLIYVPAQSGKSPQDVELAALKVAQEVVDGLGEGWRVRDLRISQLPHHVLNPLKPVAEYLHASLGTKRIGDLIVDNSFNCGGEFESNSENAHEFFGEIANIVPNNKEFRERIARCEASLQAMSAQASTSAREITMNKGMAS